MKKLLFFLAAVALGMTTASAQAVSFHRHNGEVLNLGVTLVDSIVFDQDFPDADLTASRHVNACWCSVGTSITWYNNNVSASNGRFTRGYQDRVMDRISFDSFKNVGDNGGCIAGSINKVVEADYYTIEHGINDWGHSTPVGTIEDYTGNTDNGTFAASYRKLIDTIRAKNAKAKIILCTPRKGYGFDGYLPAHWYDAKNGIYLAEYAELVRKIAEYESLPVADFFYECGGQAALPELSIDKALHPNDDGYQLMANVLIKAFEKAIVD